MVKATFTRSEKRLQHLERPQTERLIDKDGRTVPHSRGTLLQACTTQHRKGYSPPRGSQWSQHPTFAAESSSRPPQWIPVAPDSQPVPVDPSSQPTPALEPSPYGPETPGLPKHQASPHNLTLQVWDPEPGLPTHISPGLNLPWPMHQPSCGSRHQANLVDFGIKLAPTDLWIRLISMYSRLHAGPYDLVTRTTPAQANPLTVASTRQAHPRTPALSPL